MQLSFLLSGLWAAASCSPNQTCELEYPLMPAQTPVYLYIFFAAVVLIFAYGVYRKYRTYGVTLRDILHGTSRILTNIRTFIRDGLAQKKIFQRKFGGSMHSLIFYGIIVLTIGTILVGIDYDIFRPRGLVLLQGDFYLGFKLALDLFGVAFVFGVVLALARRVSFKPIFLNEDRADRFLLLGMLYMGLSGFLQEGLRFALIPTSWSNFAPVGSTVALLLMHLGAGPSSSFIQGWISLYQSLWVVHASVAFALIASIPYTKYFHVPNSMVNMLTTDPRKPIGKMSTPINYGEVMKKMESNPDFVPDLKIGIKSSEDLNWRDRIMLDSCTNCGRCESACPANAAGRDLSPRNLVQDMKNKFYKDHRSVNSDKNDKIDDFFTSGTVRDTEIFSCVMCAACVYECPADINQLDFIADLRRNVTSLGRLDKKQSVVLSNLASSQNPYSISNNKREDWAKGLNIDTLARKQDVEYLYWVGCLGSFNQRAQNISRSLAKVMKSAGISFAILGTDETCTGDPARRLGEEGLFQQMAATNVEKMNQFNVKKIVTSCPHCFNTLKNEYPVFGGKYEVIHHSQLISDLIKTGKIRFNKSKIKEISTTLHDACYVARHNSIFDEPRNILSATTDLREMHRIKDKTFCCGAGGSNYWYDVPQQKSIATIRGQEAFETGASSLATECPFCLAMFEDNMKVSGINMTVKDIAEIVSDEIGSTSGEGT